MISEATDVCNQITGTRVNSRRWWDGIQKWGPFRWRRWLQTRLNRTRTWLTIPRFFWARFPLDLPQKSLRLAMAGMWIIGYGLLIFKPPPHTAFRVSGYLKGFLRRFWQSLLDHRGTPESPGRVVTLVTLHDLQTHSRFHGDLHMYELRGRETETEKTVETSSRGHSKDRVAGSQLSDAASITDTTHRVSQLTQDDLRVWGVAYYVPPEHVDEVKVYLDIREQDGYSTHTVPFHVLNYPATSEAAAVLETVPRTENGDYYIESVIYIGTIDNESFVGPESIELTADTIRRSAGPSGANSEYLRELVNAVRTLDESGRSRDYYLEDLVALVER